MMNFIDNVQLAAIVKAKFGNAENGECTRVSSTKRSKIRHQKSLVYSENRKATSL